ncbi:MAG TPA: phytanoyl-CoA dioxygenase family protein [Polyangiaceae bacterium]|nr:phytanoyl-CoA dioxygenase family protein [Polyangiaceae bacterium]
MLTSAQIDEFYAQGFLILKQTFTSEEVASLRLGFERLEARAARLAEPGVVDGALFVVERRASGALRIERIVWCGAAEPELLRLGRTEKIVVPAAELLGGPELDQLINQAHIKNPGDGTTFHYHQDSYHRRYGTELFTDVNGRGSFVQALTAVDPMSAENGGLWVVPASHLGGHIPTTDGRLPEGSFDAGAAVPLTLDAGDTVLFGPFTVHGSGLNAGNTPRRVFINGFACAGANRRDYPGAGQGFRIKACNIAA